MSHLLFIVLLRTLNGLAELLHVLANQVHLILCVVDVLCHIMLNLFAKWISWNKLFVINEQIAELVAMLFTHLLLHMMLRRRKTYALLF